MQKYPLDFPQIGPTSGPDPNKFWFKKGELQPSHSPYLQFFREFQNFLFLHTLPPPVDGGTRCPPGLGWHPLPPPGRVCTYTPKRFSNWPRVGSGRARNKFWFKNRELQPTHQPISANFCQSSELPIFAPSSVCNIPKMTETPQTVFFGSFSLSYPSAVLVVVVVMSPSVKPQFPLAQYCSCGGRVTIFPRSPGNAWR